MASSSTTDCERFVGFAFAAADVLIELDADANVTFATGALERLALPDVDAVLGTPIGDVVCERDRPLLHHLLEQISAGGRCGPVVLRHLADAAASWSLMHTPGSKQTFVALRSAAGRAMATGTIDPTTGLLSDEAYVSHAERELTKMLESDLRLDMSLIRVTGLDGAEDRVGRARAEELLRRVAVALRGLTHGREDAGSLGEGRFAVLHAPEETGKLEAALADSLEAVNIEGVTLERRAIALNDANLSPKQAHEALRYVLDRFEATGETDVDRLGDALSERLAHTAQRVATAREIIDTRGFYVVFQPIVGLKDGVVHHNEALARIARQDMPISDFVLFAEEIGFINDFDLAVAREVLDKLAHLKRQQRWPSVAINVSARSLQNPIFMERLMTLAVTVGDPRDRVLFEVTESFQIVDLVAADAAIQRLRRAGFPVCLDDFGAGSAAFHYIRALNVDYVKLDGDFVRRIEHDERDRAVLSGMVELCRSLKVKTIAEMVETERCAGILRELGVDQAQGFLFGRPTSEPISATDPKSRVAAKRKGMADTWS